MIALSSSSSLFITAIASSPRLWSASQVQGKERMSTSTTARQGGWQLGCQKNSPNYHSIPLIEKKRKTNMMMKKRMMARANWDGSGGDYTRRWDVPPLGGTIFFFTMRRKKQQQSLQAKIHPSRPKWMTMMMIVIDDALALSPSIEKDFTNRKRGQEYDIVSKFPGAPQEMKRIPSRIFWNKHHIESVYTILCSTSDPAIPSTSTFEPSPMAGP